MKDISLLISPLAKSAYFADYLTVAQAECDAIFTDTAFTHQRIGTLDFLDATLSDDSIQQAMRLSFAQGIFERCDGGFQPLASDAGFRLHEDFVVGAKYKGKTNEMLTQLLLNIGLAHMPDSAPETLKLLDPMCGRATTLLWGMRYGMRSKGIEQDPKALQDLQQSLKKWTKLHRQKHQLQTGFVGKANKQGKGKFLDFQAEDAGMRVIHGDAREAAELLKDEKFNLIISDLPYGVQHFTTANTRNPLAVLEECADGWANCLKPDGAIVLAFNSYQPKRAKLIECFAARGLHAEPFAAPHRMSEAIIRDIVVFRRS
ncbi:Uncharacterised protein [BD1-7 clade bacterium]|uniref:Ribosomal RNA large subunit methyltransferase K/L-like methyltransferase domain-containing protein n=1 Tax=BD1-7 clade bacterium TaxID=2029982 RepID=A0A5S9PKV5_9GAMM|nr:Uncharacterised protein [BD1-7 clade bacterium]CAA0104992.1 Uncharacterised protein [BD1-7 clade bacterium]